MRSFIQPVSSAVREFGLPAGMLYLADRALRRLSNRAGLYVYELMVQPITGAALLTPGLTKHLEFREIAANHPDLDAMPVDKAVLCARFGQQAICLGAYHKGAFIGYIWFRFGAYEEDEVRCTYELSPANSSVFDFDLYVYPERRMGIGFVGIWHGANRYLYDRGIRYTFSRLTRFNVQSRRSHAHLGWRRAGSAVILKIGALEALFATVPPFVSISTKRRPRLRLRADVLQQAESVGSPA
jgi:hypothetical protein